MHNTPFWGAFSTPLLLLLAKKAYGNWYLNPGSGSIVTLDITADKKHSFDRC